VPQAVHESLLEVLHPRLQLHQLACSLAADIVPRPCAAVVLQALHESLLEVGEVFDDCARFGIVRSLINAGGWDLNALFAFV
jgi:hypothetical protein